MFDYNNSGVVPSLFNTNSVGRFPDVRESEQRTFTLLTILHHQKTSISLYIVKRSEFLVIIYFEQLLCHDTFRHTLLIKTKKAALFTISVFEYKLLFFDE